MGSVAEPPDITDRFDPNRNIDLSRAYTRRIIAVRSAYMLLTLLLMDPNGAERRAYEGARASGCSDDDALYSLARCYIDPNATEIALRRRSAREDN